MNIYSRIWSLILMTSFALAACTSPEPVQPAALATPDSWVRLSNDSRALVTPDQLRIEQRWWQSFHDPVLDQLIDGALQKNPSLQIAIARVAEARAGHDGAEAALLPDVTAAAGASRGNQGFASSNRAISVGSANLQASWELDLFGKNQARVRQSAALLQSAEASRQAVMVSLLADVARGYFDLRNLQAQIEITKQNLDTQQKTLDLIKAQQEGALSSQLDVARATAQVATTSAQLPLLQANYQVALDQLAVLLGSLPGSLDDWLLPTRELPPLQSQVLVAAPAAVLDNRPDIRAAERQFAASLSAREVAGKEIYPTLSLAGLFGLENSSLFVARPWSGSAGLVAPILDFGRIQADIDVADARQSQAFHAYQQTVLAAVADMEDALSLYVQDHHRHRDLATAAEQNRKAVSLANQQYKAGYSGLLDLLVAQQSELDAESSLATADAQLRKDLVHIYSAAGGGWDL